MRITALDHIVLNTADTARSLAWYTQVLRLEGERGTGRSIYTRDPDGNLVELRRY